MPCGLRLDSSAAVTLAESPGVNSMGKREGTREGRGERERVREGERGQERGRERERGTGRMRRRTTNRE